jgi:hypothetical protein
MSRSSSPTSVRAEAEESFCAERSCLQVTRYSAHITACLEGCSVRAHHSRHNQAEEAMELIDNHSTEKPNFVRSGADMLHPAPEESQEPASTSRGFAIS